MSRNFQLIPLFFSGLIGLGLILFSYVLAVNLT